jgi:hypothetical protein
VASKLVKLLRIGFLIVCMYNMWLWKISCEKQRPKVRPMNINIIEDYERSLENVVTERSSPRRCEEPRVGGIEEENRRVREQKNWGC